MAMLNQGGGNATPNYLQGRSKPMITPKSQVVPGEAKPGLQPQGMPGSQGLPPNPAKTAAPYPAASLFGRLQAANQFPAGSPAAAAGATRSGNRGMPTQPLAARPAAQPAAQLAGYGEDADYKFAKGELESAKNAGISRARTSASERGVFYGSPLTTSEGDIETEYLKGLGALNADVVRNREQSRIQRLSIAAGMLGSPYMPQAQGSNAETMQNLGAMLAGGNRTGPAPVKQPIAPKKPLNKTDYDPYSTSYKSVPKGYENY